jgi:hypothetical protein
MINHRYHLERICAAHDERFVRNLGLHSIADGGNPFAGR